MDKHEKRVYLKAIRPHGHCSNPANSASAASALCKMLHARTLLILVGILIIITSVYNLYRSLFS